MVHRGANKMISSKTSVEIQKEQHDYYKSLILEGMHKETVKWLWSWMTTI